MQFEKTKHMTSNKIKGHIISKPKVLKFISDQLIFDMGNCQGILGEWKTSTNLRKQTVSCEVVEMEGEAK